MLVLPDHYRFFPMNNSLSIIGNESSCQHSHVALNVLDAGDAVAAQNFIGRAAVVTLGCAKNQVDSEVMLGVLRNSGYEIVGDVSKADVAIVNTCGFLQSAVKESIDCILDVADYKEKGSLRKLIVAGCAVERYREELSKTLPEVDIFLTLEDITRVGDAARSAESEQFHALLQRSGRPYFLYDEATPRQISSRGHSAYVKVSEGCNRPCTFCIIPGIRGKMRSRTVDSLVSEVSQLGAQGVKEVNLVAQDLTAYGDDLKGVDVVSLLRRLDAIQSVPWLRILYAYPLGVHRDLLRALVDLPSVCEYLDIPLQHSSEAVLREMKRPLGKFSPRRLVEMIRSETPELTIRTTFIVGFPGETEQDIEDLESFISEGHFTNVGVFTYSAEEGTPAYAMSGQVPEVVMKERRGRLMRAQQRVVSSKLQGLIGKRFPVLIEGTHQDTDLLLTGRTRFQAPEVDGEVLVNEIEGDVTENLTHNIVGSIRNVEITGVAGYDLLGKIVLGAYDQA